MSLLATRSRRRRSRDEVPQAGHRPSTEVRRGETSRAVLNRSNDALRIGMPSGAFAPLTTTQTARTVDVAQSSDIDDARFPVEGATFGMLE